MIAPSATGKSRGSLYADNFEEVSLARDARADHVVV